MTPTPSLPDPPAGTTRARPPAGAKATLSWLAMALLTLGSVGDLGAAPATAVLGLASVLLYVLPAIVFLLPASLVSAELASGWPGGVYNWVSEGISPRLGLVAIWCQFAQTTFYYPAGVEVNAVHVDELRDAPREFPKATLLAVILILCIFILPTLAISVAVPAAHISFTAGVMQAFKSLLGHFGLDLLTPIIALGLVVAALSGLLDWLTGPSTGLLEIARDRGYLPRYFQELNPNGVQLRILVAQGIVITLIGLLYAVVPAVSRAYWVFAALATEVYLIMYVLMFVAASNLRRRAPEHPRGYRAPALVTMCVVGTIASVAACLVGLLPPSQLGRISTPPYVLALLAATLLVGVLPPLLLNRLRRPGWKADP